ncbi:MAG: DUF4097 family beta strand repeat protein [Bacillaceae bacterium]|nr:DUF4097 family beta strand repeat protein [Bacillaceae bacterium]
MKKFFGVILIGIGLIIGLSSLSPSEWKPAFFVQSHSTDQKETVNAAGIHMISLDVPSADLRLIPEDRDDIDIHLYGESTRNKKLTVRQHGDSLEIAIRRDTGWFIFNHSRLKLDVRIPEDYREQLEIDVSSGNIEFSGPSSDRPVELKSLVIDISSGTTEIENLKMDQFVYDMSSGKLTGEYVFTNRAEIDGSSGNIRLDHFSGELEGSLSAGSLEIQYDQLRHPIDLDASAGNIRIDLPDDADFTLDATASAGSITCDFPLSIIQSDRNDLRGTMGNGTYPVKLDVSAGKIHVY